MAKKAAKKTAKKASKRGATKPAGKKAGGGPRPVSTGKGPTPMEIGADLVAMFNRGQMDEIVRKWYSPKITSIEGIGANFAWDGLKATIAKGEEWMSDNVIHGASAEGPFVGSTGFAVRYKMDVETKSSGKRQMMDEVGVYTVRDGKIVQEEFMYSCA